MISQIQSITFILNFNTEQIYKAIWEEKKKKKQLAKPLYIRILHVLLSAPTKVVSTKRTALDTSNSKLRDHGLQFSINKIKAKN